MATGERLQGSDLTRARDQLRANGQPPPRRNPGSGRKRASQTVFEKTAQTVFEKPVPAAPEPTTSPARSPLRSEQMEIGSTPRLGTTIRGPIRGEMDQVLSVRAQATVHTHDAEIDHTRAEASARATSVDDAFPGVIATPPEPAEPRAPVVDLRSSSMLPNSGVRHTAMLPSHDDV